MTDEMIEAAAEAMYNVIWFRWGESWEGASAGARKKYLMQARAGLTAALALPQPGTP